MGIDADYYCPHMLAHVPVRTTINQEAQPPTTGHHAVRVSYTIPGQPALSLFKLYCMRKYLLLFTLINSYFLLHAQSDSVSKRYQKPNSPIYIAHVNVVNVITQKIDADQTVVVDNDRITAVASAKKLKIPAGAFIIDAPGKYLMPGMTDAHIHFFQSGGLYTRPDAVNLNSVYSYEKDQQWIKDNQADLMARYLACGLTTVIDVGGPLSNYAIRSQLDTTILAPNAFVTGPLISTYLPPNFDTKDPPIIKVTTEQEARELVKKQLPYKPDFIKIWYIDLPNQRAATKRHAAINEK
jgi:hypothetical protein